MRTQYFTTNPSQTQKLGEILAKEILKTNPQKRAFVVGLEGDLGGGKTTFLQGFAKGLGIKEKILSPTFVIMKKFRIRVDSCSDSYGFVYFYHIDCYRIKKPKEILGLKFKEIINNPKNIVVIEWSDRIRQILPKDTPILKFKFIDKNQREILIRNV